MWRNQAELHLGIREEASRFTLKQLVLSITFCGRAVDGGLDREKLCKEKEVRTIGCRSAITQKRCIIDDSWLGSDLLNVDWPPDGWLPLDRRRFRPHPIYRQRRHRMNLPDAPIAHEGFFATHFFTVRDQEKSKDFYVRILGGKVIQPEN